MTPPTDARRFMEKTIRCRTRMTDRVIGGGASFLLVFTPLAYGTVEPWSEAIAELVVLIMGLAWVLGMCRGRELRLEFPPGFSPAALFLVLVLVQTLPWPRMVASLMAPLTLALSDVAAAFTGVPTGAVTLSLDPHATRRALLRLTAVAAFFLVVYNTVRPRQLARLRWIMLAMGAALSMFAIVQRATWTGRFYWIGPEAPHGLAFGPFVNRAHFAGLMGIVVPVAAAIVLTSRRHVRSLPSSEGLGARLRMWGRVCPGPVRLVPLVLLLMTGSALAAGSRGGILTLTAAVLAMIGFGASTRSGTVRSLRVGVALGLMILAGVWIGGDVFGGTLERLIEEAGQPEQSSRLHIWTDATALWRQAPLLGTGLGSFEVAFPRVRTLPAPWVFAHAESDWVQLLTDTGALGLLLSLGAVLAVAVALYHRTRDVSAPDGGVFALAALGALVGAAVQGMTNFNLTVLSNLIYLAMAVAGGLAPSHEGTQGHST